MYCICKSPRVFSVLTCYQIPGKFTSSKSKYKFKNKLHPLSQSPPNKRITCRWNKLLQLPAAFFNHPLIELFDTYTEAKVRLEAGGIQLNGGGA